MLNTDTSPRNFQHICLGGRFSENLSGCGAYCVKVARSEPHILIFFFYHIWVWEKYVENFWITCGFLWQGSVNSPLTELRRLNRHECERNNWFLFIFLAFFQLRNAWATSETRVTKRGLKRLSLNNKTHSVTSEQQG